MKKLFSVFVLMKVFDTSLQAQNLVPNPSFEDYVNCPQTLNDYEFTFWDSFNRTPDYFNNCSTIMGFSNPLGFQIAHSGIAYAGFITFVNEPPLWREHLGVPLIAPLQINQTYYVSFYVSRGFIQPALDMATNKIGALFSTVQYDDTLNPSPVLNFAHVYEDSIITDTTNWVHLHWTFMADSAYEFLIIGNFFDDSQTDTIITDQEYSYAAYYYVDDVCVSTDSASCEIKAGLQQTFQENVIRVYPSVISNEFFIETSFYDINQVRCINYLGQPVSLSINKISNNLIRVNSHLLSQGIYIIILNQNGRQFFCKVIIQH